MSAQHTPEPWFVFGNRHCLGGPYEPGPDDDPAQKTAGIAMCGMRLRSNGECEANVERIVACVNACAGIPTEELAHAGSQSTPKGRLDWLRKAVEAALYR